VAEDWSPLLRTASPLTFGELLRARLWWQYRRPHVWIVFLVLPVVAWLYNVVNSFLAEPPGGDRVQFLFLVTVIVVLVVGIMPLGVLVSASLAYLRLRRQKEQASVGLSEAGVAFEAAAGQSQLRWAASFRAYERRDAFYLVIPEDILQVFPKRTLPDPGAVRSLLARRLGKKFKPLRSASAAA
jgi:hypothetical protein